MIRLGRLEIFKLLTDLNFNSGRCQNSYFEHGIGQESMRKPLVIKREWMNDFAVFRSLFPCILEQLSSGGFYYRGHERGSATLGPFHISPLDRDGPVIYRDEFRLGFIWEISAQIPRWEKAKDPGNEFWRQIRETKQTWRNTKKITFAPIIDCEQSLFFFRFSKANARARERRNEGAISHARGHLRVSRFARRTTEKRDCS